ncbi:MAG: VOC family protein [Bacteroidota bacterium]
MANVRPIPEGYTTVTPSITLRDTVKAIEFYKRAFGAKDEAVMKGPDGKVMHAVVKIGNAHVMMNDEVMGSRSAETQGGSPVSFYLYFENVDAVYEQAVAAGAKGEMKPVDMFWGDRMSHVIDPFGLRWNIATRVKDVSPDEMKRGQEEFMKEMASRMASQR